MGRSPFAITCALFTLSALPPPPVHLYYIVPSFFLFTHRHTLVPPNPLPFFYLCPTRSPCHFSHLKFTSHKSFPSYPQFLPPHWDLNSRLNSSNGFYKYDLPKKFQRCHVTLQSLKKKIGFWTKELMSCGTKVLSRCENKQRAQKSRGPIRPSSNVAFLSRRIQCKWAKTIVWANLHWIRRDRSATFELGLSWTLKWAWLMSPHSVLKDWIGTLR